LLTVIVSRLRIQK